MRELMILGYPYIVFSTYYRKVGSCSRCLLLLVERLKAEEEHEEEGKEKNKPLLKRYLLQHVEGRRQFDYLI
eukprot:scaffold12779_cov164-Ochromonas_danica.AAC.2